MAHLCLVFMWPHLSIIVLWIRYSLVFHIPCFRDALPLSSGCWSLYSFNLSPLNFVWQDLHLFLSWSDLTSSDFPHKWQIRSNRLRLSMIKLSRTKKWMSTWKRHLKQNVACTTTLTSAEKRVCLQKSPDRRVIPLPGLSRELLRPLSVKLLVAGHLQTGKSRSGLTSPTVLPRS